MGCGVYGYMYRLLTRLHPTHIITVYKGHVVSVILLLHALLSGVSGKTLIPCCVCVWGGVMMFIDGVLVYKTSHTKGWVSRTSLQPPSISH